MGVEFAAVGDGGGEESGFATASHGDGPWERVGGAGNVETGSDEGGQFAGSRGRTASVVYEEGFAVVEFPDGGDEVGPEAMDPSGPKIYISKTNTCRNEEDDIHRPKVYPVNPTGKNLDGTLKLTSAGLTFSTKTVLLVLCNSGPCTTAKVTMIFPSAMTLKLLPLATASSTL